MQFLSSKLLTKLLNTILIIVNCEWGEYTADLLGEPTYAANKLLFTIVLLVFFIMFNRNYFYLTCIAGKLLF